MEKLTFEHAEYCPVCGGDSIAATETVNAETYKHLGYKACCFECGALGPMGKDIHEAVLLWNEMETPSEKIVPNNEE